jgi:hypothetical protein
MRRSDPGQRKNMKTKKPPQENNLTPSHSEATERADELGADRLMTDCEWALRDQPLALRRARENYRELCLALLQRLEASQRARGKRA